MGDMGPTRMDINEVEICDSHTDETSAAKQVMHSGSDTGDFNTKDIQILDTGSFGEVMKLMKLKTQTQKPIGGHADKILFDGDVVWKKVPHGPTGMAELAFLKHA